MTPITFTCHSGLLDGSGLPNAIEAVANCVAANATRIEIDIHSMADGQYLVSHANRLEDATTSRGAIGRLTTGEARRLRRSDAPDAGVPLLTEVIDLMRSPDCELQLDLKDWRPLTEERIDALGATVGPLGDRVLVSSGHDWNLRAIARRLPALRLGFDPDRYFRAGGLGPAPVPARRGAYGYMDDHPLALGRAQPVADYLRERFDVLLTQCPTVTELFLEYHLVLQATEDGIDLPALARERGIATSAWTLDYDGAGSMGVLARLAAAGVDRITTNTTQQFVGALAASNVGTGD